MNDHSKIIVRERFTVKKYDGDPPMDGQMKEPCETIILEFENGQEVGRTVERPAQAN